MAKIKLDQSDRIRIYGDYKENIFIDINDQLGMFH